MAKRKKNKKPEPQKKRRSFMSTYLVLISLLIAIAVSLASTILIFFGMMPSLLNMVIMRGKGQQQKATILCMNLAGVLPFWVEMIQQEDPLGRVVAMTKDPYIWSIMWGAALVGMAMMWISGHVSSAVIDTFVTNRIKRLRRNQDKVLDEFGSDIEQDAMKYLNDRHEEAMGKEQEKTVKRQR